MVILCSLLPFVISLKNCYHGTQYSAGEDGRMTTLKLVMFCVMLEAHQTFVGLFFLFCCRCVCWRDLIDSNGTGLLVLLGALHWTSHASEVDFQIWPDVRCTEEFREREHNTRMLINDINKRIY